MSKALPWGGVWMFNEIIKNNNNNNDNNNDNPNII